MFSRAELQGIHDELKNVAWQIALLRAVSTREHSLSDPSKTDRTDDEKQALADQQSESLADAFLRAVDQWNNEAAERRDKARAELRSWIAVGVAALSVIVAIAAILVDLG